MAACNRVNLCRPFLSALLRSTPCRSLSGLPKAAIFANSKITVKNSPAHVDVSRPAAFHTSITCCNEHIINIQDDEDFTNKVLKSKTPVLIDFHATWCGPCKLLGPRLEALIAAKEGKVIMAKVDIDDHSELAIKHGVEAVPTIVAMKNGKQVDKFVGLKDDTQLKSFIDKLIGA